jgi:hypothetical protein
MRNPKPASLCSMILRKKQSYENCNVTIRKSVHACPRGAVSMA